MEAIPKTSAKRAVIVGGGFSGLAVAANMVEKAFAPMKITIIEKSAAVGPGVAFGKAERSHPLNVVAENMGLFADRPEGFYEWLFANEALWRKSDPSFASLKIGLRQYLPRKLYGSYLKDMFAKTADRAEQKQIDFEVIQDEALDIEEGFVVRTLRGRCLAADAIVLATSVPTNKTFSFENSELLANPAYIRNLWEMQGSIPRNSEVAVLGAGLTAVDVLWSLQTAGFEGHVHVISRGGKFPQSHAFFESKQTESYSPCQLPEGTLKLFHFLRRELDRLQASGEDWRHLVDGLRPHTARLWRQFELKSKRQFLRHLFSLWNRHRHRMSPESGSLVATLLMDGRLKVHKGHIVKVSGMTDKRLEVKFADGEEKLSHSLFVDYVINCTGPEYAIARRQDPFVSTLIRKGLIVPDDLGMGLKVWHDEKLAGDNAGRLFALGSLLFGECFETTSVPDIRVQAASIARAVLSGNS